MDSKEINQLDKKVSRRKLLGWGLVGGLGLAGSAIFGKKALEKITDDPSWWGKEISAEEEEYATHFFGQNPILRSKPSPSDRYEHWEIPEAIEFKAKEVQGALYPTDNQDFVIEESGEKRGVWLKLSEPIKIFTSEGEKEVSGFIAGNFVEKIKRDNR